LKGDACLPPQLHLGDVIIIANASFRYFQAIEEIVVDAVKVCLRTLSEPWLMLKPRLIFFCLFNIEAACSQFLRCQMGSVVLITLNLLQLLLSLFEGFVEFLETYQLVLILL
jgi:hypothetical protein